MVQFCSSCQRVQAKTGKRKLNIPKIQVQGIQLQQRGRTSHDERYQSVVPFGFTKCSVVPGGSPRKNGFDVRDASP